MSDNPALVWFRLDLRVADNPALTAAAARGGPVIPVFLWAPDEEGSWAPGSATRWWLHQSLAALDADLRRLGSQLILRQGDTLDALRDLVRQTGAQAVYWNRRYEPAVIERDRRLKTALLDDGLIAESFNGGLLYEPWQIQTKQRTPFQVYTPFWNACRASDPPALPLPAPTHLHAPAKWPTSLPLNELRLEPRIDWAAGLRDAWTPGEEGAHERLTHFLADGLTAYAEDRERPDLTGSSTLSPHLHFGEISPRTVWRGVP